MSSESDVTDIGSVDITLTDCASIGFHNTQSDLEQYRAKTAERCFNEKWIEAGRPVDYAGLEKVSTAALNKMSRQYTPIKAQFTVVDSKGLLLFS